MASKNTKKPTSKTQSKAVSKKDDNRKILDSLPPEGLDNLPDDEIAKILSHGKVKSLLVSNSQRMIIHKSVTASQLELIAGLAKIDKKYSNKGMDDYLEERKFNRLISKRSLNFSFIIDVLVITGSFLLIAFAIYTTQNTPITITLTFFVSIVIFRSMIKKLFNYLLKKLTRNEE